MGLLSGAASITRFNVTSQPQEPVFEAARFVAIDPGSERRESVGFVPMEPDAPYEVGAQRFVFRVRIDTLKPDPTAVRERLLELIRTETEMSGQSGVGPKKRRQLKQLAEEELILRATPRSRIIECCIDGTVLYVASTAKTLLGHVLAVLRKIGIVVDFKAPWIDRNLPEAENDLVETFEPGQSVYGCQFLEALLEDRDVMIEPEAGHVRLQTAKTRVILSGALRGDLLRYVERGAALLSAKLLTGAGTFRLDALSFQISGLSIETERHEHWTQLLDERIEKIAAVWEMLDQKFKEHVA